MGEIKIDTVRTLSSRRYWDPAQPPFQGQLVCVLNVSSMFHLATLCCVKQRLVARSLKEGCEAQIIWNSPLELKFMSRTDWFCLYGLSPALQGTEPSAFVFPGVLSCLLAGHYKVIAVGPWRYKATHLPGGTCSGLAALSGTTVLIDSLFPFSGILNPSDHIANCQVCFPSVACFGVLCFFCVTENCICIDLHEFD